MWTTPRVEVMIGSWSLAWRWRWSKITGCSHWRSVWTDRNSSRTVTTGSYFKLFAFVTACTVWINLSCAVDSHRTAARLPRCLRAAAGAGRRRDPTVRLINNWNTCSSGLCAGSLFLVPPKGTAMTVGKWGSSKVIVEGCDVAAAAARWVWE